MPRKQWGRDERFEEQRKGMLARLCEMADPGSAGRSGRAAAGCSTGTPDLKLQGVSDELCVEEVDLLGSSRCCKMAFRAGMRTFVELVSNDSAKGCPSPGTAFEPFSMFADFKACSNQ